MWALGMHVWISYLFEVEMLYNPFGYLWIKHTFSYFFGVSRFLIVFCCFEIYKLFYLFKKRQSKKQRRIKHEKVNKRNPWLNIATISFQFLYKTRNVEPGSPMRTLARLRGTSRFREMEISAEFVRRSYTDDALFTRD